MSRFLLSLLATNVTSSPKELCHTLKEKTLQLHNDAHFSNPLPRITSTSKRCSTNSSVNSRKVESRRTRGKRTKVAPFCNIAQLAKRQSAVRQSCLRKITRN